MIECSKNMCKTSLFIGNKMLGSPIEEFCFQLAEQLASCLKIKSRPEVLSNLRVESQQQLVVEFIVEINEYDYQAPLMEF